MGKTLKVPSNERLLDLGSLVIEAAHRPSHFDRWFDVSIHVDAPPFSGVVETIFTSEDLLEFAGEFDNLTVPGRAVFGGGRACEVALVIDWQNDDVGGPLAVECSVTPSGDDPYPCVKFLAFDVAPFAAATAGLMRTLAAVQPWPSP